MLQYVVFSCFLALDSTKRHTVTVQIVGEL
jgi:hypothetical protein